MCDYSLMHMPNRLAAEGETLITHKFPTGSIGLVSPEELTRAGMIPPRPRPGLWRRFIDSIMLEGSHCRVPAVCIPPGATLRLEDIPERTRSLLELCAGEEVRFTQVTLALNQFRDAIRLESGRQVLLQSLGEGLQIKVLSLELGRAEQPTGVGIHASAKGL
jgi:hypothetical protein